MNSQFTNRELTPLDYQYIILFYFLSLILTPFQGAKIDYMTMPIKTQKIIGRGTPERQGGRPLLPTSGKVPLELSQNGT